MSNKVQWVSPLPPLRTGIANYTADLFDAIDGIWDVAAVPEAGSSLPDYKTIRPIQLRDLDESIPTVIHLGNSEFHDIAFSVARSVPSVLVLHDVFLHHARAALALRSGRTRQYWRELQEEYGDRGVAAGRSIFAGREAEDIADFPMVESFVRRARAVIVHNQHAADEVQRLVPECAVYVVPMGIPIPAAIETGIARRSLRLDESRFIVGSITHVNPNKRLPVVLRAFRRLVTEKPDALLVLAGTGSDGDLLTQEIEILGLRQHVLQLGYVDDRTARILASALDACVNLRYPTAGETSASLLRLLGAGLPVLISDAGASAELPDGVGLKIPVDDREIEMLVGVLRALADDAALRVDSGIAAREYIADHHSMVNMVDGYRCAIRDVFGVELPGLSEIPFEPAIAVDDVDDSGESTSPAFPVVARAIAELGLADDPVAFAIAGHAVAELGLDRPRSVTTREASERLRMRVSCPRCGAPVGAGWICRACERVVCMVDGVPDLR